MLVVSNQRVTACHLGKMVQGHQLGQQAQYLNKGGEAMKLNTLKLQLVGRLALSLMLLIF